MESAIASESVLLKGQFTVNHKSKQKYFVSVDRVGITYYGPVGQQSQMDSNTAAYFESGCSGAIRFQDIVGCDCVKGKATSDRNAYLVIYAYPRRKKSTNTGYRKRETMTLKFDNFSKYDDNQEEAFRWKTAIVSFISKCHFSRGMESPSDAHFGMCQAETKLLVMVNPFSGPGKALHIFQQQVIPVFAEASLFYHLFITEYAGHAKDFVKQMNIDEWYGIIIVSGDGLIFEVVNGLMERPDWEKAIKKPLGCIPGGSGNALACAVCHHAGESYLRKHVLHSSFIIAKHDVVPLDLVAIDTCTGKRLYSFLSVGWGMMADVDIESEKYRQMGNARFAFMALMKIASMKKYRGRLSFLPVDASELKDNNVPKHMKIDRNEELSSTQRGDGEVAGNASQDISLVQTPLLVPLNEPIPSYWITIDDEFILVGAVYQSHLAKDNLMTPNATLNDGVIHLVLIRANITRMRLAQLFSNLETGSEINDPSAQVVRVQAFRLEPLTPKGLMTVDGEVVDYGPIQAQVLPSVARIMSVNENSEIVA